MWKMLIPALLISTSVVAQVSPPISELFFGSWRVDVISTQMKPVQHVVIERGHFGTIFWGDKSCVLTSRVKDQEDVFNASCIVLAKPYNFVDSTVSLAIAKENVKDLHLVVKGIESVDLWAHMISETPSSVDFF